jgi:hypothetical protein
MNYAKVLRNFGMCALVLLTLSACAAGRSTLDIRVPEAQITDSKFLVKIVEVRDLRRFETNPSDPSQPSLGSVTEIQNAEITSRAIGRKRGGYGNAWGDLALPSTTNTQGIVRQAAMTALSRKGYRVVEEGSPDASRAIPLSIDINQFWAWIKPGFWELTLSLESDLTLKGNDLIRNSPTTVGGTYAKGTQTGLESTWKEVIEAGIGELIQKMDAAIKAPSELGVPRAETLDSIRPAS